MEIFKNTRRNFGKLAGNAPYPSVDAQRVYDLLCQCPAFEQTPLISVEGLNNTGQIWVKDERMRMGLGSFKALGAAYVIARAAIEKHAQPDQTTLKDVTYVTASAGNHGLSVAAGAHLFGANAIVYLSETVPKSFAKRLRDKGAQVRIEGADYAASLKAAQKAATENNWVLLSDSSWDGYTDIPYILMEGYLQMAAEVVAQLQEIPSHVFLQAGVGGLACAMAAFIRKTWDDQPVIVVVEPDAAPALIHSVRAGKAVYADGPESVMGRLDCKEPSLIALNGLARDADYFMTLGDADVLARLTDFAAVGLETSASGGAGLAAALHDIVADTLGLGTQARILTVLSEGPA